MSFGQAKQTKHLNASPSSPGINGSSSSSNNDYGDNEWMEEEEEEEEEDLEVIRSLGRPASRTTRLSDRSSHT